MEFASGTCTQSSAQNNACVHIKRPTNQHISVWHTAAGMALDEMDPAACEEVVPHLPSGLYEASPVDNQEQSTLWPTSGSGWGTTDRSTDSTWPPTQAKLITKTKLLNKIKPVQDRFQEDLVQMEHDDG